MCLGSKGALKPSERWGGGEEGGKMREIRKKEEGRLLGESDRRESGREKKEGRIKKGREESVSDVGGGGEGDVRGERENCIYIKKKETKILILRGRFYTLQSIKK